MTVFFQHVGESGGSLSAPICLNLVQAGFGISAFMGIGGDRILGATTAEALVELDNDDRSDAVVIVGEIGGAMKEAAANYVPGMSEPVVTFIAGSAVPSGKRMGHAGAIVVDTPTAVGPALQASMGC